MNLRPEEISSVIKEQIKHYSTRLEVSDVGTVIQVADGIARIHGLEKAKQGELLEFPNEIYGMVLNLEEDNVGAVLLGDTKNINEGDTVKTTGRVVEVPVGDVMLGRVVMRSASQSTAKDRSTRQNTVRSSALRPVLFQENPLIRRSRPVSRQSTRWCRSEGDSAS